MKRLDPNRIIAQVEKTPSTVGGDTNTGLLARRIVFTLCAAINAVLDAGLEDADTQLIERAAMILATEVDRREKGIAGPGQLGKFAEGPKCSVCRGAGWIVSNIMSHHTPTGVVHTNHAGMMVCQHCAGTGACTECNYGVL